MTDGEREDAAALLEACADVVEFKKHEASAHSLMLEGAARALKLARRITRDWELTDEEAVCTAWKVALDRVEELAECPRSA